MSSLAIPDPPQPSSKEGRAPAQAGLIPPGKSQHVLLLAAQHAGAALLAVEFCLNAGQGELCGLTLRPVGAIVEGVLRLKGLSESEAEAMAAQLALVKDVQSVRLEHYWSLK